MGVLGSISLSELSQQNLGLIDVVEPLSGNFPSSNHYITLLHTGGYHYLQLRSSDHMGNLRKGDVIFYV